VRPDVTSMLPGAVRQWHENEKTRRSFWASGSEARKKLARAFNPFKMWYERYWARGAWAEDLVVTRKEGPLPGDCAWSIQKGELQLAVVGLNSAFLQLEEGDYLKRLALHPRQLGECGAPWIESHHAALLLTHHPTSWLHPRALADFEQDIAPVG